jgi:hypothetical protein
LALVNVHLAAQAQPTGGACAEANRAFAVVGGLEGDLLPDNLALRLQHETRS